MDEAALHEIEAITRSSTATDGAEPLDEGAWRRLRHHADELDIRVEQSAGFTIVDGELLHLVVAPEHRGRGLGAALLADALDGSRHPWQAWSHGDHPAAAALATTFGFDRTRALWVMRRSLAGLDTEGAASEGYSVRSFRSGDELELLRVNAAAFSHHPEQAGMDAEELAERMAEPWFDPAGLLVATDDQDQARVLGFHWTKRHSASLGEVYVVGIDPAAQGRGVGRTLVSAGLRHLQERGIQDVLLYVESDNDPAVRLYDGLGFKHAPADTHVMYTRAVSAPGS